MALKRFSDEPAFVLHRYDWSETSLVLEVFTRHHGRIALVAKGVKRPSSQFRPVLLPLQPLHVSWTGDAEVRTLKAAQWQGGHVMPTGEALVSGSYLNELLMRLLARDDAHERLFDHFTTAVQLLAEKSDAQQLILRAFELLLLRDVGLLPDLSQEGSTLVELDPRRRYVLLPESGLSVAHVDDEQALTGAQWLDLQSAMDEPAPFVPTLRACASCLQAIRLPLRNLLHYHCGVRVFKTRQLMLDVQAMTRRPFSRSVFQHERSMTKVPGSLFHPTALSVNLNKVALVRNTRHLGIPSVTRAATLCLQAGAQGITVHPRPDERHIRSHDVHDLAALLKQWPDREYNIEGNPFHNLMGFVRAVRPQQVTFVPDSEGQFTSDHGWNFPADAERLRPLIAEAKSLGARVSLFMDAEPGQMAGAKAVGADRVELYTEPYAAAWSTPQRGDQLERFRAAAQAALDAGLGVNAGHDLNRDNLTAFLSTVPGVSEVSIGHALISDALEMGYAATIADYNRCIAEAFV